jgi:hypothetical protein
MAHFPGEGIVKCLGLTSRGVPCGNNEIEGLEYCLHHLPDDLLEEGEQITGFRRCRERFGQPDACRYFAVEGTEPPACKNHGANAGSVTSREAGLRVIKGGIDSREADRLVTHWESIISAPPVVNPLEELQKIAGEMLAWKNIARSAVAGLQERQWRYAGKTGEQIRAEILVYERALDRVERALVNIAKLNIDQRLAAISERRMDAVERALTLALQASGCDLEGQSKARTVLRRELKSVS